MMEICESCAGDLDVKLMCV